jgi:hypothetical protein
LSHEREAERALADEQLVLGAVVGERFTTQWRSKTSLRS